MGKPTTPKRRLIRLLVLLALAVLVPSIALLWLLDRTVRSERVALEGRFRSLCQDRIDGALERWETRWREAESHWAGSESYRELLEEPLFATAAKIDPADGRPVYPRIAESPESSATTRDHPQWAQARWLEFKEKGYAAAEQLYASIEIGANNPKESQSAWQGRVRCMVKDGRPGEALALWSETSAGTDHVALWETALYLSGENIGAEGAQRLQEELRDWLADENRSSSEIKIHRRLFMMDSLAEAGVESPTRAAEHRLASIGTFGIPERTLTLEPEGDGFWKLLSADRESLVFINIATVDEVIGGGAGEPLPISLNPPGSAEPDAFASRALTGPLAGWQLAISADTADAAFLDARASGRSFTVWIAWLALAAAAVVAAWLCRAIFQEAKLNRLKNDFLAAVSHELKTPVTAIGLLVENLERKGLEDARQTGEYLGMIGQENERLRRLIDNFLSFSRMERNKQHFASEPVRLDEIVADAADTVRGRYPDRAQDIVVAPQAGAFFLEGDREALTTVMVNLIDNAVKYSSDDVHLALDGAGDEVRISVSDRGIGMSADEQRQAFEKFYRADPSLTNEAPGVGLGLSIVDFVVRAHRGEITIDSQPGEGSCFTVRLPLGDSHLNAHATATA